MAGAAEILRMRRQEILKSSHVKEILPRRIESLQGQKVMYGGTPLKNYLITYDERETPVADSFNDRLTSPMAVCRLWIIKRQ